MVMAWMKLRRRNIAPLLNANGWAVNASAKVSIPFGNTLTDVAKYPKMRLKDPYAKSGMPAWLKVLITLCILAGAAVEHSDGYPGWSPNPYSMLLKRTVSSYEQLFGVKPVVRAVHAGLECGLFLEKYPSLEMVSFGPTVRGVHSPDERLNIDTVDKFWQLLKQVVKSI